MFNLGDKMKGSMKNQVSSFLEEDDYEVIAEILNEQLHQQARILETTGTECEFEEIPADKIELAIEKKGLEKAVEMVLNSFNKKQLKIQKKILKELNADEEQIRAFPGE